MGSVVRSVSYRNERKNAKTTSYNTDDILIRDWLIFMLQKRR